MSQINATNEEPQMVNLKLYCMIYCREDFKDPLRISLTVLLNNAYNLSLLSHNHIMAIHLGKNYVQSGIQCLINKSSSNILFSFMNLKRKFD